MTAGTPPRTDRKKNGSKKSHSASRNPFPLGDLRFENDVFVVAAAAALGSFEWRPRSGGFAAIWAIQPDGSGQTKLFTGETEILAARWTPSGDAVYYFTRVNQTVSLNRISIDHTGEKAHGEPMSLVSGLETDEGFGISANGKRLVYARAPYYAKAADVLQCL